jgi:hypothetical protein
MHTGPAQHDGDIDDAGVVEEFFRAFWRAGPGPGGTICGATNAEVA